MDSDDAAVIEKFIQAETASGTRGIFDYLNPRKPGTKTHGEETLLGLAYLFFDVDSKDTVEGMGTIAERLKQLPLKPTRINNSGHGFHVIYELKENVPVSDPAYTALCRWQSNLIEYLCADRTVRPWSFIRRPGTPNTKRQPAVMCETVSVGLPVDATEFVAMAELLEDSSPLFERKAAPARVMATAGGFELKAGPVDVDDSLACMKYEDKTHGVNATHCHVIPSLLRKGIHPDDVVDQVVAATMAMAQRDGLSWSEAEEVKIVRRRTQSAIQNLLLKGYDYTTGVIPAWLNEKFHDAWIAALNAGKRPDISWNPYGFFVRSWEVSAEARPGKEIPAIPKDDKNNCAAPKRFRLVTFDDLRPGPEPLYLVDELIPVAGMVDVWGKAKCYKTFWSLDLMLHVAMGWEYRDRYVRQGAVVYCAFEGAHGYKKRIEACAGTTASPRAPPCRSMSCPARRT